VLSTASSKFQKWKIGQVYRVTGNFLQTLHQLDDTPGMNTWHDKANLYRRFGFSIEDDLYSCIFLKYYSRDHHVDVHQRDKKAPKKVLRSKRQQLIYRYVKKLFPSHEVQVDYKDNDMRFSKSTLNIRLDLYIPSLSLAFESLGSHHFASLPMFGKPLQFEALVKRDQEKREV
jgi:hypothetical protein